MKIPLNASHSDAKNLTEQSIKFERIPVLRFWHIIDVDRFV